MSIPARHHLTQIDGKNFDVVVWFVGLRICSRIANILNDFHAFDDASEYGMFVVQPGLKKQEKIIISPLYLPHIVTYRRQHRNEELTAIRVGSSIGRGQCVWTIMSQRRYKFIFEISTPNRFATRSGASWIACLYHETFDYAMEDVVVVIAILGVHTEVLNRFRTFGGE